MKKNKKINKDADLEIMKKGEMKLRKETICVEKQEENGGC